MMMMMTMTIDGGDVHSYSDGDDDAGGSDDYADGGDDDSGGDDAEGSNNYNNTS
jgi:hypothetical protein